MPLFIDISVILLTHTDTILRLRAFFVQGFSRGTFEWTDAYSVSVLRFDTEHKKLFSLINELNDAMAEKRGRLSSSVCCRNLANTRAGIPRRGICHAPLRLCGSGAAHCRTPRIHLKSGQFYAECVRID